MLSTTQANALVYSTLCGFMLVGLFAGYKVRSTVDFLSGIRTQSGKCSSFNFCQWRAMLTRIRARISVSTHLELDCVKLVPAEYPLF